MRIGYARVSTEDQILDLQRDALKRAKCRQVYEEQATGKNTGRPQLEACLKSLREGDTLVVWRLDRLGRNLADLVGLVAHLDQRNINFESLTEKIETGSPARTPGFPCFRRPCRVGAEPDPRTNGSRSQGGACPRTQRRPPGQTFRKEVKTIRELLKAADVPVTEIAMRFNVARSTLYRTLETAG